MKLLFVALVLSTSAFADNSSTAIENQKLVKEYNNSICTSAIEFMVNGIQLEYATAELLGREVDQIRIDETKNVVIKKCTKN